MPNRTSQPPVAQVALFKLFAVLALSGNTAWADTNIVWSDEFNGTSVDTSKWTFDIGNGFFAGNYWVSGWGNNELEYYTSRTNNVYVAGGNLHIHAQQESYAGFDYTSARLKTKGLFYKMYGRFEWRVKLPAGTGLWPALWMLPENSPYGGWPNSGEIDVMENNGATPDHEGATIHYGGAYGNDVYSYANYYFASPDSVTNWHMYDLIWNINSMQFFVDGNLFSIQTSWYANIGTSTDTYPYPAPFNTPFYILMNLAIGGNFIGNPSTNEINPSLPAEVLVDYVRVYDQTPPMSISCARQPGRKSGIELANRYRLPSANADRFGGWRQLVRCCRRHQQSLCCLSRPPSKRGLFPSGITLKPGHGVLLAIIAT